MYKIIVSLAWVVLVMMFEFGECNADSAEAIGITDEEVVEFRSEFRAPPDIDYATGVDEVVSDEERPGEENGPDVFEGDDITNVDQLLRSAIRDRTRIWPNATIPYNIGWEFSNYNVSIIAGAMQEIQAKTCVKLVPRFGQWDHVAIRSLGSCSSYIGRAGGRQVLSLGEGCLRHGIVVHELMHALGFWHEQSRADRDDWVKILWENISPDLRYNFDKFTRAEVQHLGEEYDYDSIMHYPRNAFAIDPKLDTIVPLAPGAKIGQRKVLSPGDARKINKLYMCDCADTEQERCADWVRKGHCTDRFWKHMAVNCRKSCDLCG